MFYLSNFDTLTVNSNGFADINSTLSAIKDAIMNVISTKAYV